MQKYELFDDEIACVIYNYSNDDWHASNGCFSGLRKAKGLRGLAEMLPELISYSSLPVNFYTLPGLEPISGSTLNIRTETSDRDELLGVYLSTGDMRNFAGVIRDPYGYAYNVTFSQEFTEMELINEFDKKEGISGEAGQAINPDSTAADI